MFLREDETTCQRAPKPVRDTGACCRFGSETSSLRVKDMSPSQGLCPVFWIGVAELSRVGGRLGHPETTPLLSVIVVINICKPLLQSPHYSYLPHFLYALRGRQEPSPTGDRSKRNPGLRSLKHQVANSGLRLRLLTRVLCPSHGQAASCIDL